MPNKHRNLPALYTPQLTLIPQDPSYLEITPQKQIDSHQHLYEQLKKRNKNKSKSTKKSFIIVRSDEEKLLMQNLKPKVTPLLSPTNSISISDYLKTKYRETHRQSGHRSTFTIKRSTKKIKNTQLDNILDKKQKFMKTYFSQLKDFKKKPEQAVVKQEISYEFPEVFVNDWKVKGFLRGNFVLLKGWKKDKNHLPTKQKFKKYPYSSAWAKIRENYQKWVNDKFCFQD